MASKSSPFGRTVLVTGPESLLADRQVTAQVKACRAETPDAQLNDVQADAVDAGVLAEITGGSLFAERSVAVIRDLANLPADLTDAVLAMAQATPADLALVLVHGGGQKGRGLLDKLKKSKQVEVVDCPQVKQWEVSKFVVAETRAGGGRIDSTAAQLLVDSVGHDLRSLAAAVDQLLADSEDQVITEQLIGRYFAGRAETTSFVIADLAMTGQTAKALEQLRWALATGVAPVLITSALASGVRGLGKLSGLRGSGLRDAEIAKDVGVPPWKLKSMRSQLRAWDDSSLAQALTVVAVADADIKGAADNADYALERAVLAIAGRARG
ncbi:DNA polymerase III subunit delta [Naumannella halotolerans]|uniref:DNA-directed DNA polymerase n=1 Tax=Naumannella halotolerans TaxID=993414 RepID=A0A4R7JBC9_9ACTN|nr:DNA polymerase III subunit delta [Naumannella halotolerans]TDT33913.1 DNA polymerase III delta subunit [Naumannella halotolerans]